MTAGFAIESLSTRHDKKTFACGVTILDRYLHELAAQDMRRRVSNCFVACDSAGMIAGFYTFAAASLPLSDLPPEQAKRLPRYGVMPAALIGRLAVDQRFRGQRLGSALVMDAVYRAVRADPAIFALIVDAKDDAALAFYRHLGFQAFISRPMSLYLTMATAVAAAG